ncbi:MAG: glycosyltransferase family 4 protein [Spirochaetaceae bacterium]|nr:glycosyltransferase family 4 protein [Spirochaetaceae bacterium]
MRIAVDCRMLGASGVGVYLRETLACFLDTPPEDVAFLLLGDRAKLAPLAGGRRNVEVVACGTRPFSLRELLWFPAALVKKINRLDAYFSPSFNVPAGITVPVYTTIHDLVFSDMPELTAVSTVGLMARMWFYRRAFRRSKTVFTVSVFSKSRIEHHLGLGTPVVVVYNGCSRYLAAMDKDQPGKRHKTGDILFTGNIKKHKGLAVLLRAFFAARAEGLENRLVIVGDKDNFRSRDDAMLAELERADPQAVCFTGRIPDDALKTYLTQSAVLVQPSLYEGFGIPPLEAMMCGTQALVSDIPVFRELYSDFPVVFFKPGDAGDLQEKLMALLFNKEPETVRLSESLRARYTYEKTASSILRAMAATALS